MYDFKKRIVRELATAHGYYLKSNNNNPNNPFEVAIIKA
jgi:hypothetical protein